MNLDEEKNLAAEILKMAREFGADLAGFVDVESLQRSPSHKMHSKLPLYELDSDNATADSDNAAASEENQPTEVKVNFSKEAQTILIIAICHPEDTPTLDYWRNPFPGGTEGNLRLIRINNKIIKWLKENESLIGVQIPYAIEQGGLYLKDAAAREGVYARATCKLEMDKNRDEGDFIPIDGGETMRVAAHCRACEFVCPVGAS